VRRQRAALLERVQVLGLGAQATGEALEVAVIEAAALDVLAHGGD
jgi:hypothetical protein